MNAQEFRRRERDAAARLAKLGELENARAWLRDGGVDAGWIGTPLEFAELEMPIGFVGALNRLMERFYRSLGM